MLRKILVTLDGSELAEQALPYARSLAEKFDGQIILLWVVQPGPLLTPGTELGMVPYAYDEVVSQVEGQAETYLSKVRADLVRDHIATEIAVLRSHSVADAIVDFADREGVDLIVKTTHGRSGISRWLFGSVAARVLQQAPCPVFLVRVKEADD